jgi:hypothetical protein
MRAPLRFVRPIVPPMGFNSIRGNGRYGVTPLLRRGQATQRGTTQFEFSSGQTANVHLSTLKFSPAKNADPLVIERIPAPGTIAYAQDQEPIIEINMSDHIQRAVCSSHQGTQSERRLIVS